MGERNDPLVEGPLDAVNTDSINTDPITTDPITTDPITTVDAVEATESAQGVDELPTRRRWFTVPHAWRQPLTITGAIIVGIWVLVAIFASLIEPYDPLGTSSARLQAPSGAHWFGTDTLGRDVFSRVVAGAQRTLPVALLVVLASALIGCLIGAIAGYFGRAVDEILMRLADLVFAFPMIILAMVITAALGPGLQNAILAMLLVNWPQYARVSRSLVLGARNNDYVIANRLLGAGVGTSLGRDILPNILAPLVVLATMDIGTAILTLSGLSFLGLGTVPPTPEWGAMVSEGVQNFSNWWIAVFSGLAIFTAVVGFNFIGDALRDALDPRTQKAVGGRAL